MESKVRIDQFLDDTGRIIQMPSKHKTRGAILEYLITKFEPDTEYTERQINDICDEWHTFNDYFLMRREMVDTGLLGRERDGSRYWRIAKNNEPETEQE